MDAFQISKINRKQVYECENTDSIKFTKPIENNNVQTNINTKKIVKKLRNSVYTDDWYLFVLFIVKAFVLLNKIAKYLVMFMQYQYFLKGFLPICW